jgi:hypothetical protein
MTMGLAQQWTYIFGRGYTGGPDFELNESYQLDLDGITLEATLPRDNVVCSGIAQPVNFPFRSSGWFDTHCKQTSNHFYACVLAHNWAYLGPYWKVMNEPFGILSASFWIKRTLPGRTLVMDDLTTLDAAIHWDYEEFFEAEEPGQYGRGNNTQARQEADQMYDRPYEVSEGLKAQKAIYLKQRLCAIPSAFERRRFDALTWVYYGVEREPNYPIRHYCHPLDGKYYLDLHFHYGIHFREYFHLWQAHAEAAEQRIMSTVRLRFP